MKLGTYTKQPTERESYTISYLDDLNVGDKITGATATPSGPGVTVDQTDVFDDRVRVWVVGGADGTAHKITVTSETEDGRILVDEFVLKIKDY